MHNSGITIALAGACKKVNEKYFHWLQKIPNSRILPINEWDEAQDYLQQNTPDICIIDDNLNLKPTCFEKIRKKNTQTVFIYLTDKTAQYPKPFVDGALEVSKKGLNEFSLIFAAGEAFQKSRHPIPDPILSDEIHLFRTVLNLLPDFIYVKDAKHRFLLSNRAHIKALGESTMEAVIGKTDRDFFAPSIAEKFHDLEHHVLSGREVHNIEERVLDREGREKWVSTTKIPLYDAEENIVGLVGISRDITDQKRAQIILGESEQRYSNLFHHSSDGIILSEPNGKILDANEKALDQFGYSPKAMSGLSIFDLHPMKSLESVRRAFDILSKTSFTQYDITCRRKDSTTFPAEVSASSYQIGPNVVVQQIFRDITDRIKAEEALRRSEEQLRQSQKMEAMGRLAGGVAHDFNNVLMAITGHSELILSKLNEGNRLITNAEEIRKASFRAASLTRQLLAFSRKQILQPKILDLRSVVRDLNKMLHRVIGEDIRLQTIHKGKQHYVKADPNQIEQVLLNLAINARDAMPEGGSLKITSRVETIPSSDHQPELNLRPGNYVVMDVTDTGHGMDAHVLDHLFEPFFTTKAKGKGTGLGLSTVYGIIKQSDGDVVVKSSPGSGTTFSIYLPQASGKPDDTEPRLKDSEAPEGSETILLVEDDNAVRSLVYEVLEMHGYNILEASNGEEALEIFSHHKQDINLILSDVVMPKMGGPEFVSKLLENRENLKVLFISGYNDEPEARQQFSKSDYLQKPFTPQLLAQKVREMLDEEKAKE